MTVSIRRLLVHGTILAESGDGTDDESRVFLDEGFRVEAEVLHDAGAKVFHDHVGGRDQVLDEREVIRVLEVEGDALFAEIP